mgnify:CR=1 FL=1
MVKSVNFVVLGKQDIASEFGKKGTETDLTLYDRKESDIIKTWVTPSGFPDKIQPLFQAINLAEYVILYVDKLDKFTGEQIIALDSLKKEKGILSHTFDVDESKLDAMIKGTVVEKYTKVDQNKIKEEYIGIHINQSKKEDSDPQLHLDGQDESSKPLINKVSIFNNINLVKEGIGNIVLRKPFIAQKTHLLQPQKVPRPHSFPRGISTSPNNLL